MTAVIGNFTMKHNAHLWHSHSWQPPLCSWLLRSHWLSGWGPLQLLPQTHSSWTPQTGQSDNRKQSWTAPLPPVWHHQGIVIVKLVELCPTGMGTLYICPTKSLDSTSQEECEHLLSKWMQPSTVTAASSTTTLTCSSSISDVNDNCILHRHLSHYQECYQDIATAFSHLVGHLTECDVSLVWMKTMGDEGATDNDMHV